MTISEINNKDIWENFLSGCEERTFLDSWNWGEFQAKMGNKIWRLGVYTKEQETTNSKQLVATVLVVKIRAKRGIFLLIQHGPTIKEQAASEKKQVLEFLLEELKKIGKEENCSFIRMNPLWECNQENKNILQSLGFRMAPMHANAYEATWKLDLSLSEEEILKNMRKTTRYLIRQALKSQDITIEKSERLDDIRIYQKLNMEISERQNFVPFSFEYIKNEFEVFSKDNQSLWLFGKYKGELAAAALIIFLSGIGFYHQAASSQKYVKFSIPYLIQWEAIKEAKKRGCKFYDFWGFVDPKKEPQHPWAGPTLFKMGFGGYKKEYVKTQDFPISKKYWLSYTIERIRKSKRGL
jgi:lipid II:glycine glycyltransferase (peptidoglycan interpeptide bridge formation enzyme)